MPRLRRSGEEKRGKVKRGRTFLCLVFLRGRGFLQTAHVCFMLRTIKKGADCILQPAPFRFVRQDHETASIYGLRDIYSAAFTRLYYAIFSDRKKVLQISGFEIRSEERPGWMSIAMV